MAPNGLRNLYRRVVRRLKKEVANGRTDNYVGQLINLKWLYKHGLKGSALQHSWVKKAEGVLDGNSKASS